jgi:aubergine
MWPGYDIRLCTKEAGIFLCIEPCHRVVRYETVLDCINQTLALASSRGTDPKRDLKHALLESAPGGNGIVVVTKYNNKAYKLTDIAFDKTPESKFVLTDGQEMSFAQYLQERYGEKCTDTDQIMLVSQDRRTGRINYLVPEMCRMTGLTEALTDDFRAMRDIKALTHSDAPVKVKEC